MKGTGKTGGPGTGTTGTDLWLVSKGVYSRFNGIKMTAMTDTTFYIDL